MLGFINGKVSGLNFDRHTAAVQQRVPDGLNHIDMESIPLDIGPAALDLQFLAAAITNPMPAHSVPAQLLIDISQGQLSDAPDAAWSQLETVSLLQDIAPLFE